MKTFLNEKEAAYGDLAVEQWGVSTGTKSFWFTDEINIFLFVCQMCILI